MNAIVNNLAFSPPAEFELILHSHNRNLFDHADASNARSTSTIQLSCTWRNLLDRDRSREVPP